MPKFNPIGFIEWQDRMVADPSGADIEAKQECEECQGSGEIECCECGHDRECPECDGKGTIGIDLKDPYELRRYFNEDRYRAALIVDAMAMAAFLGRDLTELLNDSGFTVYGSLRSRALIAEREA